MNAPTLHTTNKSELTRGILNRMTQIIVVLLIDGLLLFGTAGTIDWIWAWVYLGTFVVLLFINAFLLLRKDPELVAERGKVKDDTKGWDKILSLLVSLVGPFVTLIVAGLDYRFVWSPELSLWVHAIGWLAMIAGFLVTSWAMLSNPFFSGTVRIQSERGHKVAESGPYRFVRHPGYVGMSLMWGLPPLLLGSLWALIPGFITIALLIVRTALEDRTLQNELQGYREYAGRVRNRLVPGIW